MKYGLVAPPTSDPFDGESTETASSAQSAGNGDTWALPGSPVFAREIV